MFFDVFLQRLEDPLEHFVSHVHVRVVVHPISFPPGERYTFINLPVDGHLVARRVPVVSGGIAGAWLQRVPHPPRIRRSLRVARGIFASVAVDVEPVDAAAACDVVPVAVQRLMGVYVRYSLGQVQHHAAETRAIYVIPEIHASLPLCYLACSIGFLSSKKTT